MPDLPPARGAALITGAGRRIGRALALACMRDGRVLAARVRVEKPQALAPAVAGVEITLRRGEAI